VTAVLTNGARQRLDAGELALGVILRQARTVDIAPIMKSCGYDWLFLDLEHNSMDLDTAVQIAVAALGAGIAPVARVPAGQLWMATRFLDGGGLGIVMPHVDTPEEAHKVAQALRYPPLGHRSVAGGLPHFGYAKVGLAETCSAINAATFVVVMLETPTAIANADEIAAVPGVDVLLIGTNDLCAEMGIPGDFGSDRVADAYQTMIAASRRHGKFPGMAGIYNEPIMQRYIEMGARFILSGADAAFLIASATQRTGFLRKTLQRT
jgi:4-hydroxy-2-oxoheptanedioate aldolase